MKCFCLPASMMHMFPLILGVLEGKWMSGLG